MKTKVAFLRGIPTKQDVDKLIESLELEAGEVVPYQTIADVLGFDRTKEVPGSRAGETVIKTNHRWRTVVSAWRKRLLGEHGIDTAAEAGVGIRILLPPERIDAAISDLNRGTRALSKGFTRNALVPQGELSPEDQLRHAAVTQFTDKTTGFLRDQQSKLSRALKAPEQSPPAALHSGKQ